MGICIDLYWGFDFEWNKMELSTNLNFGLFESYDKKKRVKALINVLTLFLGWSV